MIRRLLVLLVTATLLAGACSGDDADGGAGPAPDDDAAWLGALGTDVAVPAYEALVASLADLADAAAGSCTSSDDESTTSAWLAARDAWERSQSVGMGPAMDLRLNASVDFAVDPTKVVDLAAGSDPVDADSLAALGADVRGLGAVELLVIAPDEEMAAVPLERRCAYAEGAALAAEAVAAEVLAAWTTGVDDGAPYVEQIADPEQTVDNRSLVLNQIVAVLRMTALDLGRAEVAAADGAEVPDNVPEGPAGRFVDDVVARLAGAAAVLGDPSDGTGLSVSIAAQSEETATRAVAQMVDAQAAVDALPRPLAAAMVDDPGGLDAAAEATAVLTATLSTEVASLLGATIGLGDADGDS